MVRLDRCAGVPVSPPAALCDASRQTKAEVDGPFTETASAPYLPRTCWEH